MTSEITGKWYNGQNIWEEYQYEDLLLIYKKSLKELFFIENSCCIIYNKTTAVIHKMNEW